MRLFIPSYVDLTTLRLTVDGMETEANVENGFLEISFDPTTVDEIALHFDIPVIRNVTMPAEDHMFGYTYSKGFALLGQPEKCAPPGRIFQASFRSMITWHAVRSASSTYAASSFGRVTFSG